ncbi:uncharacterized protein [Aegilops tauschii subsp. strangulata]|uniref:Protein roadkill n=1 Tax=Aegilops tauschii TaxID=37682 RepID=N1R2T0_AEGTA
MTSFAGVSVLADSGLCPATESPVETSTGQDKFIRKDALERSPYLRGNYFIIRCDIMVFNNTKDDAGGRKALLPDICHDFNVLFQTEGGVDVKFEVGGDIIDAHRCVLAARSKVFMAQLFGPMKETSSVIQIKDMEAKVFGALLSFIYTDSFPEMLYDNDMETDKMPGVVKQEQKEESSEDKIFIDVVEWQNQVCIHGKKTYSFPSEASSWGPYKFIKIDALERSMNLEQDDCFTIRCDTMVCNTEDDASDTRVLLPDIHHNLINLLHSKSFMAQLFGPMKEGTSTPGVIHIKDMEAKAFKALLDFIYTDSFPDMEGDEMSEAMEEEQEEKSTDDEIWLQWLHDLLVAADRYDIQWLKCICEKQMSKKIGVRSVMSTLALAEQHHCQGLKEACFKFIQVESSSCLQKIMMHKDLPPAAQTLSVFGDKRATSAHRELAMSSFASLSVLSDGKLCPATASPVDTGRDCGNHLLVVHDCSRTKKVTPTGDSISSRIFMVGGHGWYIEYFPNGENSGCADFISLSLSCFRADNKKPVEAMFVFSFVDQVEKQNPVYLRQEEVCIFAGSSGAATGLSQEMPLNNRWISSMIVSPSGATLWSATTPRMMSLAPRWCSRLTSDWS